MKTLTLNNTNLYQTHHILLESFDIPMPEPKITKVSIPGRNGDLDMSEALTGYMAYDNRAIEVQLGIVGNNQNQKKDEIIQLYGGKIVHLEFSHLDGYFKGRCIVKGVHQENDAHTSLQLRFDCEPYRYETAVQTVKANLTTQMKSLTCQNFPMPTQPTAITTGNCTIQFKQRQYVYQAGEHLLPFLLTSGDNFLQVSGTGILTLKYQRGKL